MIVTIRLDDTALPGYYYFFAIDAGGSTADGPIPVARGPYWGNGWGTGPITSFVECHLGRFEVDQPMVVLTLTSTDGSVTAISGLPTQPQAGRHDLTVGAVALGTAGVAGTGVVTSASNLSSQNAGAFTITTDNNGVVTAPITFTPAAVGGRPLTDAEAQALAGLLGQTLGAGSLAPLEIQLQVTIPGTGGTQTLTVNPTTALLQDVFTPDAALFSQTISTATVTANTVNSGANTPYQGVAIRTARLVEGQKATVVAQMQPTAQFIGPPFSYQDPTGRELHFVLDLDQVAPGKNQLEFNIITTDQLIFDPNYSGAKIYDGLGRDGNDFVSIRTDGNFVYSNSELIAPEERGDCSIAGLDIVDWQVETRIR